MDKYRIAVCDDDEIMRDELSAMCADILTQEEVPYEVVTFSSAYELEKQISEVGDCFELLILDIQMDGMNGMELAHLLREKGNRISIIFVSACDEYLLEGYDVQPIYFILKPVEREYLARALNTDLRLNHRQKTFMLHVGNKTVSLTISEIRYVESLNHKMLVHQGDDMRTFYMSLTELEKQLPAGMFARCHNSYLVNLKNVNEITRTYVRLTSGETLPIGRAYYQAFQSAFIRSIND